MTDGQIEYKGGDPNLYHPQMLVVTITKKTQTQKADHGTSKLGRSQSSSRIIWTFVCVPHDTK